MTAALVFMDTETTGLAWDADVWEFAGVRRESGGAESELHLFIEHSRSKCQSLPEPFQSDHQQRWSDNLRRVVTRSNAAGQIAEFIGTAHLVGAVPSFDDIRLTLLLRNSGQTPGWHYHLIDVENLAVGYLANSGGQFTSWHDLAPPWDSEVLSRAVGVDPDRVERHTAMGDVKWAMAIYDAVMGIARSATSTARTGAEG